MGKRSITTIVATVVAAIAVAGGATAASKYLITSIHQIKPTVLKHLQAQLRSVAVGRILRWWLTCAQRSSATA